MEMTDRTRRTLGLLTAAGALPYLTLKAIWLAGGTIGVRDAPFLADPSVVVLNTVTVLLDAILVALALALTRPFGARLPAWMLLLPIWVGTGFLLPMVVAILPVAALGSLSDATGPLEPWVQPLVYGGFAWQGVGLALAFVSYAVRRWGAVITRGGTVAAPLRPLLRVLVGGGAAAAGLSGLLHVVAGIASGSGSAVLVDVANALFAAAGALGVARLAGGATEHRFASAVAGWVGTGAMFAWGLWSAVLTMAGTALAHPDPISGPAALAGLLGGFALAVAGLVALAGAQQPVAAEPARA
ncbi:hypothetical protein ACQEVB_21585 [Pseudonocardia sp. CA-107938]|uniref:hypothetical protein n=1 Tax=Pseudonocardia sp. CA-107938 TaxID=3240021 RepID=UPI003D8B6608